MESLSHGAVKAQSDVDLGHLTRKNESMVEYEIKTDDRRLTLESFDAVVAAVRSGQIGRAAQIREKGEKDWTPVASVEALKGFFSTDIWSAWDEESDESLLDAFQKEEEPRAPVPLEASPTLIDEVEELPAASLEQVDVVESKPKDVTDAFDSPRRVLPAAADITPSQTTHPKQRRRPPAQVIDFPVPEELESIGAGFSCHADVGVVRERECRCGVRSASSGECSQAELGRSPSRGGDRCGLSLRCP